MGIGLALTMGRVSSAQTDYYADRIAQDSVLETEQDQSLQPLSAAARTLRALREPISVDFEEVALEEALREVATRVELQLSYGSDAVKGQEAVTLTLKHITAHEALQTLLESTNLRLVVSETGHLVLTDGSESIEENSRHVQLETESTRLELEKMMVRDLENAQDQIQHPVSGSVTDASNGEPLMGVNVRVVGTTIGTATDQQGEYELEAPTSTDSLQFTFVGYENQTIAIDGQSTIDVAMQPTTLTGGEVVVTGYSTQQRRDLTGSVEVVDMEALQDMPQAQISDRLQGMASGLTVISSGQPGKDPQIRIRGINTFGNNTPLFVVDGVPTQRIDNLNPSDIAEIQVLKDASAASIYGARAANGVVIIETRTGDTGVTVEMNSYAGISRQPEAGENPFGLILDPKRRAELTWLAHENSGVEPSSPQFGSGDEPVVPDFIRPAGGMEGDPDTDPEDYFVIPEYTDPSQLQEFHQITRANKEGTRWFDQIMQTAPQTKTDLTVSGGGEQGSYLFSGGYLNQESTLIESFLERYSVRVNTSFNKDFEGVIDNVRIGENLSFTSEENQLAEELEEDDPINLSAQTRTIVPVYDIMGNFAGNGGGGLGDAASPYSARKRTRNDENLDKRLFGNAFLEVTFLDDFRLRSLFGASINSGFDSRFEFPEFENSENNTTNALTERSWHNNEWTFTNTLNYQRTVGQSHNVAALLGTEWVQDNMRFETARAEGFFSFDPNFINRGNATGTRTMDSGSSTSMLASQFANVDYNYASRYFLSGTLRRDGSSKFLEDRYGIFPAASGGWRISEEAFMEDVFSWLTDLKVRVGWGVMGNQLNVTPDNAFTLFRSVPFGYDFSGDNGGVEQVFRQSRLGAPDAKWERQTNQNIGVDLAVLDGQLEATIDYYRKDIEDLLFNPELPATGGQADAPFVNTASMKNTGVDASLRGQTEIGDLQIEGNLNFTSYDNEITSIAEGFDSFSEESRRFQGQNIVRNEVGQEMSSYYGFQIVDFFQEDDFNGDGELRDGIPDQPDAAPGRFRYEDVDGDGEITFDDRTFLGSPNPDFTYGLNLRLHYHNWDFSASLYGSQGVEAWNQMKWWTHFFSSFNNAKAKVALTDSWTPDNPDAEAPIVELGRTFSTNQTPNSYFVEDASYLRIQNVRLGYTLPSRLVDQLGVQRLRFYIQSSNVFTFTGYSNPEPEIGANDPGDVTSFGIDSGAFPRPRQYIGGVNLTF